MSQLFPVMYAKLFSRIAQSSLMEEKVTTRYVFMMMLALSDRNGDVIGTDVAIARMMNVSVDEFKSATEPLLSPDPDSNSQSEEGRRLVPSDNGRGYKIVNYLCYRDMKSEEEKREYMRNYMRERRSKGDVKSVKSGKNEKTDVKNVTHTEADTEADTDTKKEKRKKQLFQKPSVAEIESYCQEIKAGINAEKFHDYYEAKGWVVGKSPMKDWKAAVRTWKSNQQSPQPAQKQLAIHQDPEHASILEKFLNDQ